MDESQRNKILDSFISVKELYLFMKEEGLVFAKLDELKQESLKDKILKKKWITLKEIADSKIWGVGTKTSVERIIKDEDIDLDTRKPPFKVHRLEVERIAKNRNII